MTASTKVTALSLMLCLAPVSALAQDTLTLEGAIQEALTNNASLRAARAGAAEAAEHVT